MNKRILVIDDEPHIRRLVQVNLERAGFTVEEASDGREGLQCIRENCPDMVISDVMMPHMDGLALLKEVRACPELRDLPFILLTAKASDADVFWGWSHGTDMYLTKPFSPAELLAFVARIWLDRERGGEKRYQI